MSTVEFEVVMAEPLPEWANEPEFAWFKEAYLYASNKTQAIPALSKCTPEEIFYLMLNMMSELDLLEPHPTQPFAYGHPITRPLPTATQQGAAPDPLPRYS